MKRSSGVLLHITSLPSEYGVGDLGPSAYEFADFLAEGKQSYWQVLPLNPVEKGGSPYSPSSVFAGNPLLVSPQLLVREGLLPELPDPMSNEALDSVNYTKALAFKDEVLRKAYGYSIERVRNEAKFQEFCSENSDWLDDYSLFMALREEIGKPWNEWPADLRSRKRVALNEKVSSLSAKIQQAKFAQFLFFSQWISLRKYCASKGLSIAGDLPFYVSYDSSDVWSHQELFKLDQNGMPLFVSGVPPDYFSATGQLWSNPVYDWEKLEESGFAWWLERISANLKLFDLLRLDHFRGYVAYWEVPSEETTAVNGRWSKAPSENFFAVLKSRFPSLPSFAEDLGFITQDVKETRIRLGIPGSKVLLFAFGGSSDNEFLPFNYDRDSVAYTGTHDTNTARGWFDIEASGEAKDHATKYLGVKLDSENVAWEFIRLAMSSTANLSIIPMQDLLSLGVEARMNNPAVKQNNWRWRLTQYQRHSGALGKLREMTEVYGRAA